LRAATGTPIRRIAFANSPFAEADPEQRDEGADVDDILKKLPLPSIGKLGVTESH